MLGHHWFKEQKTPSAVKAGATYRHIQSRDIVEIARVLDISSDSMGIPHVTYDVQIEKSHFAMSAERRTSGSPDLRGTLQ